MPSRRQGSKSYRLLFRFASPRRNFFISAFFMSHLDIKKSNSHCSGPAHSSSQTRVRSNEVAHYEALFLKCQISEVFCILCSKFAAFTIFNFCSLRLFIMSLQLRNSFLLFITASIWGSSFVAQALGMEHVSPFTFTWGRSIIGGLFLLAVIPFLDKVQGKIHKKPGANPWRSKTLWFAGFICGTILFISESLQQFGLLYTTVGKAGFLTSLYIVIVPVLGIFLGRTNGLNIWVAVVLALVGLWLLCMTDDSFTITIGDSLVIACALSFSLHILVIDRFAPFIDVVRMSCIQFFIGGVWGFILMMLLEPPSIDALTSALGAILFCGILSNGVAYTLQAVAQRGINPTIASLIMSLESVVSVIAAWIVMGQTMNSREICGCIVMALAIVIAQLPQSFVRNALNRIFPSLR